jgi:hypothetical protein
MIRKVVLLGSIVLAVGSARTSFAASTSLLLPQGAAFAVLGHSCGGIQEQAFATGFDATTGYPTGDVYLQTRCGGSGRGGGYHVTTYAAWATVNWDLTGAVVGYAVLPGAPAGLDPAFSALDAYGNELDNQLAAVNVLPANCSVGNTTYCTYRAYLTLAPDFVPPPRVTGISVTSGPSAGGTSMTITGTGFSAATAVSFGDVPAASFTVGSDTSISALSPASSGGTVDVTVSNAGGTSASSAADQFTFVGQPVVSGISPDSGPVGGGTEVTISGVALGGAIEVDFGENPAGFTVNDDTSITAVSPAVEAVDDVTVKVVTIGGTSAGGAVGRFHYTAASTGCGGACVATVQCARLHGTMAAGTVTIAGCTPKDLEHRRASLDLLTGTLTWSPSGETTIVGLSISSPGQGVCRTGSVEYDLTGSVAGGTSAYGGTGEPVSAQTCLHPSGRLSLVRGTAFAF